MTATGYSRSPRLAKGAFVKIAERFVGPVPNVIVFQYNPKSLTRTITPWADGDDSTSGGSTRAQPAEPGEDIKLKIELDATDDLEQPERHPIAAVSGVAARLAALELLLYPAKETLLAKRLALGLTPGERPAVLFVWGPGRILPVQITSFMVEETLFSPTLYPLQATVDVGLRVVPPAEPAEGKSLSPEEMMAAAAYRSTQGQKEILARTNLLNTAETAGLLPF